MINSDRIALSFDVGGTFTDFVLTSPSAPAIAVLRGWSELVESGTFAPPDVGLAVHSTTLVTNSIIERKGAKTALLATQGFKDVLELGREQMYDIYDLFAPPPEPLVPRPLRLEIDERVTATGEILREPSAESLEAAIKQLRDNDVESVVIAFLHSYRNPTNEEMVAAVIQETLPGISLSLSSQVAPIAGEYERTSTAAADGFTKPAVRAYVGELRGALSDRGLKPDLHLIMSSGEIASADTATSYPIRLLESGPASGAIAAAFFGKIAGHSDVLSLDMGGTTAKACVIEHGKPEMAHMLEAARVRRFMKGSGLPIVAPVVDLIEIGAGGGSIARMDELGLLKVGPDSAGANPGPACYGLGGEDLTVSDANLVLGYLNPDYFLGGEMKLNPERASAVLERLAKELDLSVEETAWGIHRVVNENMAAAARVHIIERNRDPRSLAVIAFGGAGPAHASAVARILGSPAVIFPPGAGVASALGALVAPIAFTTGRTLMTRLRDADWSAVSAIYDHLADQAVTELESAGVDPGQISYRRWAEMRLEGQDHEIDVPLPRDDLGPDAIPTIEEAFAESYRQRYGRMLEGLPIEVLQWRVTATGPESAVQLRQHPLVDVPAVTAISGHRPVYYPDGGFRETPVFNREILQPGMTFQGPVIVEEREATVVISPGDAVRVDEYQSLVVDLNGHQSTATDAASRR